MANFCLHGNDPSGSTKGGKFLNQLKEYQLINRDSALQMYLVYIRGAFNNIFPRRFIMPIKHVTLNAYVM
jgi:hypothetical protein